MTFLCFLKRARGGQAGYGSTIFARIKKKS